MSTVGERIAQIREQSQLNQKDFAAQIGATQGALSKIETGLSKPSYETLETIGTIFGVSLDWLILNKGNIEPKRIENSLGFSHEELNFINLFQHLTERQKGRIEQLLVDFTIENTKSIEEIGDSKKTQTTEKKRSPSLTNTDAENCKFVG